MKADLSRVEVSLLSQDLELVLVDHTPAVVVDVVRPPPDAAEEVVHAGQDRLKKLKTMEIS